MAKLYFRRVNKAEINRRKELIFKVKKYALIASIALNIALLCVIIASS